MSNLTTILNAGLNNPDCAFYTGAFFGNLMFFKLAILFALMIFVYKATEKLAFEPLLNWLKNKIYKTK